LVIKILTNLISSSYCDSVRGQQAEHLSHVQLHITNNVSNTSSSSCLVETPFSCELESPTADQPMAPALLTAIDSTSHIHLIIGSNPLAGARCTRSLEVGALPKLITPAEAAMHYGLTKGIEEGRIEWIKRAFHDSDLTSFGRASVDGVVDAVFVTLGARHALSMSVTPTIGLEEFALIRPNPQVFTYLHCVVVSASQSTWPTRLSCARSLCSPLTTTALCRLV
jgi:hypothetical protein